ncbi:MAG: cell division ATP-binding protein FtsE [Bacillota bacterium]
MITTKNLSLRYKDGTFGLQDVNVSIPPGEIVYITGQSGSGKTSFIKLLLGMERPTSGQLHVLGKSMDKISDNELRKLRQQIGPVFQDFKLLDGRPVNENVLVGMRFLPIKKEEMYERALKALEKVGLSHKIHSSVENLSYGERQRVAIARSVARNPKLIIADEPTGNLDKKNSVLILELLKSFKSPDTTVIITTHATHLIQDEKDCIRIQVDDGKMTLKEGPYGN